MTTKGYIIYRYSTDEKPVHWWMEKQYAARGKYQECCTILKQSKSQEQNPNLNSLQVGAGEGK